MENKLFSAFVIILWTSILLAVSIAVYDLLVQISTYFNLYGSQDKIPFADAIPLPQTPSFVTGRQIIGQVIFVTILFGFAILIYVFLDPIKFTQTEKGERRVDRPIRDLPLFD